MAVKRLSIFEFAGGDAAYRALGVEDEVEIGVGTCVDRGSLGETRIGRGSKLDNLIQVGHGLAAKPDAAAVASYVKQAEATKSWADWPTICSEDGRPTVARMGRDSQGPRRSRS